MSYRSDRVLTLGRLKKSLAACAADECHGECKDCALSGNTLCLQMLAAEALKVIENAEKMSAWKSCMIEGLLKERDALLADLRDPEVASRDCLHCKHYKTLDDDCSTECDTCEIDCRCKVCIDYNNCEWRGVRGD